MGGNLDRESTKFVEVAGLDYFDETLFRPLLIQSLFV